MSANIYKEMVYSYKQPAWHALGVVSQKEQFAEEVLDDEFGGAFTTEARPVTVTLNGQPREVGDFAIVRSSWVGDQNEEVFGYCTGRYNPMQPRDVAQCWDLNVAKHVETMAFLGNGNDMFISTKMPSVEVVKGDDLDMYLIVRTGFDTMKGTKLFTATVRPVCSNTITLAQNWAKKNTDGKGRGEVWTGKHVNKNLLRDLGYWMKAVVANYEKESELVQGFFQKLAKTPVKNDAEVYEILYTAFPPADAIGELYPNELRGVKEVAISDESKKREAIRDGIFQLFSGAGTAITPDYWGVLNSTSEYFCHIQPSKKPIASSVMWGKRNGHIMNVMNVLKERVGI